ncbi:hypothetical protein [Pararhodobacter zhoushanensis]|uniref:hypothetical protein n=1 Tax=Pararhodobacter zhoushanensis TaxID=2479545 RepID=UPI000F8D26FE|nr:hypothetical protein [Pararhodobacter zhoushanensis]
MSNPDSFIDEVNEELKRDRLYGAMRKYGWIAIALVLIIVGAAAFNEWRKAQDEAAARSFGDAVISALDTTDPAAQRTELTAIDATGDRAGILNLLLGAADIEAGDRAGAMETLARVENDSTMPLAYRQIAAFKRVIIGGADIPVDERRATLQGLAQPGQTFRPLALEQLALLTMETGDQEGALAQAQALLQEPDVTDALRRRVAQLIVVLGGDQPSDLG